MAKILIVESEPAVRSLFEAVLRQPGRDVVAAESGEAALEVFTSTPFDCVILGSPVAVMSGGKRSTVLEQLELVRSASASRIIVLTTGVTNRTLLRRAVGLRVYAIFGKPFDPSVLQDYVRSCVEGRTPARRWYAIPQAAIDRVCKGELTESW